jgi:hypothetical protein
MDLRRLRPGEWIVGAAGVALFVSLFLDWYDIEASRTGVPGGNFFVDFTGQRGLSGWDAFDVVDIVLAVIALAAIALAIVTATQPTPAIAVSMASIVTLLAFVAFALVVYRAIDTPTVFAGFRVPSSGEVVPGARFPLDVSPSAGLWLGLGASVAMIAGSWLAIRDERPGAPAPAKPAEELPAPGR